MPGICVTALRIREKDQAAAKAATGASWVQVGLVFTTRAGTPFEPRNLNRRFETRCVKAGVRRITVHHMRHTCATLQFRARRASAGCHADLAACADRRDEERLHRGLRCQDAQGAQAAREAAWLVGVAVPCCCTAYEKATSLHGRWPLTWVGVAGFEPAASSSRSQVAVRAARAAACLNWQRSSVSVRWRPRLAVVIVTHLVTRSFGSRCREALLKHPVSPSANRYRAYPDPEWVLYGRTPRMQTEAAECRSRRRRRSLRQIR